MSLFIDPVNDWRRSTPLPAADSLEANAGGAITGLSIGG